MPMTFGGRIEPADFVAAQRLHRAKSDRRHLVFDIAFAIVGVIMLAMAEPDLLGVLPPHYVQLGMMISATGIALTLLQWSLPRYWLPRTWRRLHTQQKSLQLDMHYHFDESGLFVATSLGQSHRPWDHVLRRLENDAVLLLYHSDNVLELIPQRWLSDPEVARALDAELSRHSFSTGD